MSWGKESSDVNKGFPQEECGLSNLRREPLKVIRSGSRKWNVDLLGSIRNV
jgi:hypothetical protein